MKHDFPFSGNGALFIHDLKKIQAVQPVVAVPAQRFTANGDLDARVTLMASAGDKTYPNKPLKNAGYLKKKCRFE